MRTKISLNEATIQGLYNQLNDKTDDVEGLMDGVLIITDPNIDKDEYEELIDRANEIIEDTPEGELPLDDSYIGEYIHLCPICGSAFVEDHILEPGTDCPICMGEPEAFTILGQIQGEDDAMASATDGNLQQLNKGEDDTGFASTLNKDEDKGEDEDNNEDDKNIQPIAASEQVKSSNLKLTEDKDNNEDEEFTDFVRGDAIKKEIQDMLDRAYERETKIGIGD